MSEHAEPENDENPLRFETTYCYEDVAILLADLMEGRHLCDDRIVDPALVAILDRAIERAENIAFYTSSVKEMTRDDTEPTF